jgi:hypothetical protein
MLKEEAELGEHRLYLEVVPEGPVAKHLEKGVVVHVLAYIVQIIVFSTCPDALLGVASSCPLGHVASRVCRSKKDRLELEDTTNYY